MSINKGKKPVVNSKNDGKEDLTSSGQDKVCEILNIDNSDGVSGELKFDVALPDSFLNEKFSYAVKGPNGKTAISSIKLKGGRKEVIESFPETTIVTSGPVLSGANTDSIVASNGPVLDVVVSLVVPSGYEASEATMVFTPGVDGESQTQTYTITEKSSGMTQAKSITVTWQ